MLALGRLLRLSLAPSAVADIAAGTVLAAGTWPGAWRPFLLVLASLCVYHGGMALNDWADREEDARNARARPIPSGAISARLALVLAAVLLTAGPLIALTLSERCGLALGLVAVLAVLYDLVGRGPWLGPVLLGACRAGNLACGILLGLESPHLVDSTSAQFGLFPPQVVVFYGLYVFCVSRLARLEDAPESVWSVSHPSLALGLAAVVLAIGGWPLLLMWSSAPDCGLWPEFVRASSFAGAAIAAAGALGLLKKSIWHSPWTRSEVMASVGMALRRLLVATSAIAAQAGTRDGLLVAGAILCGYPLSFLLRRVFPPT